MNFEVCLDTAGGRVTPSPVTGTVPSPVLSPVWGGGREVWGRGVLWTNVLAIFSSDHKVVTP